MSVSLGSPIVLLMIFTMCFPCVCYNINKSCLEETRSIGETQHHNLTPQMMHAYVLYHHNTIYYA